MATDLWNAHGNYCQHMNSCGKVVPLFVPNHYSNRGDIARTKWMMQGLELTMTREYKEGKVGAEVGVQYVCVAMPEWRLFLVPRRAGHHLL